MKNKSEVLIVIESLKEDLRKRYKVKGMGLFGSLVKGEEREGSDIDILVDFEEGADLFDLVGLGLFLEERLDQKVDMVPRHALRKELMDSVLKDAVNL